MLDLLLCCILQSMYHSICRDAHAQQKAQGPVNTILETDISNRLCGHGAVAVKLETHSVLHLLIVTITSILMNTLHA